MVLSSKLFAQVYAFNTENPYHITLDESTNNTILFYLIPNSLYLEWF